MPYGDSALVAETSWPAVPRRRSVGVVPLALATLLSFAAGIGSTLVYLQTFKDEIPMAALPLIEADKAPTRVRPEGFDVVVPRVAQASPSGLPSAISSAMAAVLDPVVELTPQGIPQSPDLAPPVAAAVIEIAPLDLALPAIVAPVKVDAPSGSELQFQLQLASMRTPDGAREEMSRLKRLHADLLGSLELTVQRIDQGARGVFYRVLSSGVGERPEAAGLCTAIAQKRGQCVVVALRPAGPPVPELRLADVAVPVAEKPAPALNGVVVSGSAIVPTLVASSSAAKAMPSPPAAVANAQTAGGSNGSEIRAQLGSLRSMEGATREVTRLTRLYGPALGPTELTVSRIDQGERGVFYRILTAPLPSRDAASDLCQRLAASQAGCVLLPVRPTA